MKKFLFQLLLLVSILGICRATLGQERWFQIEASIFTNENKEDILKEQWEADRTLLSYPNNLQKLNEFADLFLTDDLILGPTDSLDKEDTKELSAEEMQARVNAESIMAIGPDPMINGPVFKLFDFQREGYLQLSSSESDFQQTNRALERSPNHRLLFHGIWRQAVVQEQNSTPVYIEGGLAYGEQHELQGSLAIHFNENEDRVVINTNLWLTEFSIVETNEWVLPSIPNDINREPSNTNSSLQYYPIRIYHMKQDREMRSTEFHYLDHPSIGLVVTVKPYEIPLIP